MNISNLNTALMCLVPYFVPILAHLAWFSFFLFFLNCTQCKRILKGTVKTFSIQGNDGKKETNNSTYNL